ncbi:MAG TPA: hypothetical protein PK402_09145 [Tepidisphaeraceae bacterium]|nr:hypothetical protein [Tepidisphaeraceae bacterium]
MRISLIAFFTLLITTAFVCAQPQPTAQSQAPWLEGFPTIEKVEQTFTGKDALDAGAKQRAVYFHLNKMINTLAGPEREFGVMLPEENALKQTYGTRIGYFENELIKDLSSGSGGDRSKWFSKTWGYDNNIDFRADVISKLFTQDWRSKYLPVLAQRDKANADIIERARQRDQNMTADVGFGDPPKKGKSFFARMFISGALFVLGFIILIPAMIVGHWVRRREFYRRNSQGVEEFNSYGDMVKKRSAEQIAGCLVTPLVILGFLILVVAVVSLFA